MERREFTLSGAVVGLALAGLVPGARAQGGAPVEGKDFLRVAQPVSTPPGKVDVVEFFGYWCPHCHAFEPLLDAWVRKLPSHVSFRRMPIAFQPSQEPAQRLYFALEALGLVDTMHRKVFNAIHSQRQRLDKDSGIGAWASANGADGAKIMDMMKSFSVSTKARQAMQLAGNFRVEGVPTLGIAGRYLTSPSIAGAAERALTVADALIVLSR